MQVLTYRLGSAGDTESNSEASEDDDEVNQVKVNCCEEDVFLSDPLRASSPCSGPAHVLSPHQVSLDSLSWVATLGVGGFGRVELVTAGAQKIPFALKKMKKTEVSLRSRLTKMSPRSRKSSKQARAELCQAQLS